MVPEVVVPLLSREGLTRRLLPGAAAPWSPALGPVPINLSTPATDCFVLNSSLGSGPADGVETGRLGSEVA